MSRCRFFRMMGLSCLAVSVFGAGFSVLTAHAVAVGEPMPGECQTFCATSGGKAHPICNAVTQPIEHPTGSVSGGGIGGAVTPPIAEIPPIDPDEIPGGAVLGDEGTLVANSGLPQECESFCSTSGGAGHALCVQAERIANMTSNQGGSGLMVNNAYRQNTTRATTMDPIAARTAREQEAEARRLGGVISARQREAEATTTRATTGGGTSAVEDGVTAVTRAVEEAATAAVTTATKTATKKTGGDATICGRTVTGEPVKLVNGKCP